MCGYIVKSWMNVPQVYIRHRRSISEGQFQQVTSDPATSTPRWGMVNHHEVVKKTDDEIRTARTWVVPEKESDDGIEPHEDQPLKPI